MDTSFAINQITTVISSLSTMMVGYIPYILIVFGALVGLGIGLKYVKKWIGTSGVQLSGREELEQDVRNFVARERSRMQ